MSTKIFITLDLHGKTIPIYWDDDGKFYLPDLYVLDKLNRISYWRVYVLGDKFYSESGIEGGKTKCSPGKQTLPKNVGKANATSGNDQAFLEAFSLWKKKKDSQYSEEKPTIGGSKEDEKKCMFWSLRPALAQDYKKAKHHLKLPFAISEKIDGIRAIGFYDDEKVHIISRNGKAYHWMKDLRTELKDFFAIHPEIAADGELYNHELTFSQISSIVKKGNTKACAKGEEQIQYWIFDLFLQDKPYVKRMELLKSWELEHQKKYPSETSRLKFIYYDSISDHDDVKVKCAEYMERGFEGAILRNLNSLYKLKHRSSDLQKYKEFKDDEYEITGMEEGSGLEKGCAIYVCKLPYSDTPFNVRPKGTHEERREIFLNQDEYIGKMLTVRYQELSEYNVPRFPVGVSIRDYE